MQYPAMHSFVPDYGLPVQPEDDWSKQFLLQNSHCFTMNIVVTLTHRPRSTRRRFLVLICIRGQVDPKVIVRPEGLGKLKKEIR
jgi:hypothetical protein